MHEKIQLSDHFTGSKLMRFVTPSVLMMIFTSIYTVVDGVFVSNFTGKTPFAAVNLIFPILAILGAAGFMIGTGGTALVSKILGEGDREKANKVFSLLIYFTLALGTVCAVVGACCMRPIAMALGAEGQLLEQAVYYGVVYAIGTPAFMLQAIFQSFFATAEKPKLGLLVVIGAGLTNIVLDAVFVAALHWGVPGAALASVLSQCVGGLIPLVYFVRPNGSLLRFGKAIWDKKALLHTCINGSSELMINLSGSVVNMMFNAQLLKLAGQDGVAAYGFIMYVCFVFMAVFFGYSVGVSPIVGYHYGAQNHAELHNLLRKSLLFVVAAGLVMEVLSQALAVPLARLFVGYDAALFALTVRGFRLYAIAFILAGFNVFASGFFTALNNGLISALISFARTLGFQIACVMLMPLWWGLDGVWLSVVVAETLSLALTITCLCVCRKKYHY